MKKLISIALLALTCLHSSGQGRKVESETIVYRPAEGDTIVSRIKGTYEAKCILRNNGPDSIKVGDKYSINVTFGNVQYGYFFRYASKNIGKGKEDTLSITLAMIWDISVPETKFCATITLKGALIDSIKKETEEELLNNKNCQTVAHESRLAIQQPMQVNINVYPNPSNGVLSIAASNAFIPTHLKLTNCIGEELATFDLHFYGGIAKLDLSNFPQGIYFIKLANQAFFKTIKVLIR